MIAASTSLYRRSSSESLIDLLPCPSTPEICSKLEQHNNKIRMLSTLRDNKVEIPSLVGIFQEYENYGLPGYSSTDPDQVKAVTLDLLSALKNNTKVKEFTLNLKALELLLTDTSPEGGIGSLIYCLQNNPSLETLHIRIPPFSPHTSLFQGLFDCQCQNLKGVTLWIPRQTTNYLGLMRVMSRGRGTSLSIHDFTARIDPSHPVYSRSATLSTQQSPGNKNTDPCNNDDIDERYEMNGIASFLQGQPNLTHVRIQSSSLRNSQWAELMQGLTRQASHRLNHLELRRVEFEQQRERTHLQRQGQDDDENDDVQDETYADPSHYLALLAPRLHRLELHGTALDASPLLIAKTLDTSNPPLHFLSLSSSKLVGFDCLMDVLSSPTSTLNGLELSHLNMSGDKCQMLANMLRLNQSIEYLDISSAQLDCIDGVRLAMALKHNNTLLTLIARDNHMWHSRHDSALQPQSTFTRPILVDSFVSDEIFWEFGKLLEANTRLESLDLSDNGPPKMKNIPQLALLLNGLCQNTHLKSLVIANRPNDYLDFNAYRNNPSQAHGHHNGNLDPSVSEALATVLRQDSLRELILNYNLIGDADMATNLGPALRANQNLKVLGLKGTHMGNNSMIILAKSLERHPSIESLDVSFNPGVTREGYVCLSRTIETLPNLHSLWFHNIARNRYENLETQCEHTEIIGRSLKINLSLKVLSNVDLLKKEERYYLRLNQWGRQQLSTMDKIPSTVWPKLLASMPVPIIYFYVRQNATLLSSISGITMPVKRRSHHDDGPQDCGLFNKRHKY